MGIQFIGSVLAQSNSGPLPISQGGTGQITAPDAINALLPVQIGNNGRILSTDGVNVSWVPSIIAAGGNDTNIQYNDNNGFGGSSSFVINKLTGALTSTSTFTNSGLHISNNAGLVRPLTFRTAGLDRWVLQADATLETGSSTGSNFGMYSVTDNGLTQTPVLTVSRATQIVDFKQLPTINGLPLSTAVGTVTYVGISGNNGINVTNSPIISSGTIVLNLGDITPTSVTSSGTISGFGITSTSASNTTGISLSNSSHIVAPFSGVATTRTRFITSAANSSTMITAASNGTPSIGTTGFSMFYNGDVSNSSYSTLTISSSQVGLLSTKTGTGTLLPLQIGVNTTDGIHIDTSNNVTIPGNLTVSGSLTGSASGNVLKSGDTMTGYLILNADPTTPLGAATKQYVDNLATGITVHAACETSTTAAGNLPAATYNNGTGGVGATLTANANGSINAINAGAGVGGYNTLVVGARVLVKDQATQLQNGIYVVTSLGAPDVPGPGAPWVLTRASDFDGSPTSEVQAGDLTFVQEGTLIGTQWAQTTIGTGHNVSPAYDYVIVGTDNIVFTQFAGAGTYTQGTGINIASNIISNTGVLNLTTNTGLSTNVSATGAVTVTNTGVIGISSNNSNLSVSSSTGSVILGFSSAPTFTGTNFTGIPPSALTSNSLTIGTTNIALGAIVSTLTGLTSVTSTTFVGSLSGNATTSTTATNIAGGVAGGVPYQSGTNITGITAAGVSGQVLTSNGSVAPTWQPVPPFTGGIVPNATTFTSVAPQITLGTASNAASLVGYRGGLVGNIPQMMIQGPVNLTAGQGAGGLLVDAGGQPNQGSQLTLTGGSYDATYSSSTFIGGNVLIQGGNAATNADGGIVTIIGGNHGSGSASVGTSVNIQAGTAVAGGGTVNINGGLSTAPAVAGGPVVIKTAPAGSGTTHIERLRILADGSWSVGSNGITFGTSGQVLTSNGAGTPPTWSPLTAPAGALTGTTLASNVVNSSLTSVGILTSITTSGNLTFNGTGQRIISDLSNVTPNNRMMFQTSTTNGLSALGIIPNGSGTVSQIDVYNNSDTTNAGFGALSASSTDIRFISTANGTGTILPATFYVGASERFRIGIAGELGVAGANYGTSGQILTSNGTGLAPSWSAPAGAAAGTLSGTTLAANVVNSSLTSVGTLISLNVSGPTTFTGSSPQITLGTSAGVAGGIVSASGTIGSLLSLTSGTGTAGAAGAVNITSGGATNGNAGTINITGGTAITSTYSSGTVNITGGIAGFGNTIAGDATLSGGDGSATGTTGGNAVVSGGNGTGTSTVGGNVTIKGGIGNTNGGYVVISTAPTTAQVERLRILNNGAWSVGSNGTSTGSAGQVLASTGATTPPAWTSTPTLTGTNFTGIPNSALTNSSATIGSTVVTLGSTVNALAGLVSVTATTFTGSLSGNATTATDATNATNTAIIEDTTTATSVYPTWVTANTGNLPQKTTSTRLSFVPSTGVLTATQFTGSGAGLTSIPNGALTNSSVTIGTTNIALGATSTTLAGLTSVTSTTFVGSLSGNASTATTSTNIAGGLTGNIPYQTGANATSLLATGTSSQVLVSGAIPSWTNTPTLTGTNFSSIPNGALMNSAVTIGTTNIALGATSTTLAGLTSVTATTFSGTATNAVNIAIIEDTTTATSVYPTWVTANTGNLPQKTTSTRLSFVPSTGVLTATQFAGSGSGLTSIPNSALINSSVTIGSTSIALGATSTTLTGLASVTSTSFTGALTGAASSNVLKAGDTMTGPLILNADPTLALGAATKQYVDTVASGVHIHGACETSTTAAGNLPAATYNNGTGGVGATLTATANANLNSLNSGTGVGGYNTLSVGSRVLVKDQATQTENGIYVVTALGADNIPGPGALWVLTRASDFDGSPTSEVQAGDLTYIQEGTLAKTQWAQTAIGTGHNVSPAYDYIIIGTDNIIFSQFAGAGTYTAGSGINIASNIISNTGVLSLTSSTANLTLSASSGAITLGMLSAPTLTGTNFTSIPNSALTNSSITIGTTPFALGTTSTTLAGLTSVTSTSFVGTLTGNASSATTATNATTATTLQTARAINGVSFNGSADIIVPTIYDSGYKAIINPQPAQYTSTAPTVNGAIAITLPVATNSMFQLTIKVYEYVAGNAFEIHCGGYFYTIGNTWANNPYAYIVSNQNTDRRFTIRMGYTSGNQPIIYIGELASAWSYPQVFVTECLVGYSGQSVAHTTGWGMGFEATAFQNVSATITNPQVGYAQTTNVANSVVLRDASGNFSAGAITATSFTGSGAGLTSIPNTALTNNSFTLGSSTIYLGDFVTSLTGIVGVTSQAVTSNQFITSSTPNGIAFYQNSTLPVFSGYSSAFTSNSIFAASANNDTMTSFDVQNTTVQSGTFTGLNAYGVRILGSNWLKTGTGTVANAYGIYAGAPTIGTNNYAGYFNGSVTVNGTLTATNLTGTFAGNASTATNITGGAAGNILYQSAASTTSFLATGTSSQVLVSGATPLWTNTPTLTGTNFTGIPNGALTNNSVTIGTTNIALGATSTTLAGLTGVGIASTSNSAISIAGSAAGARLGVQINNTSVTGYAGITLTANGVNKYIQLNGASNNLEIVNSANSVVIVSVTDTGAANFNSTVTAPTFSGNATTATTATNIAGGAAGGIPYQTGAGATSLLTAGTSAQVLISGTAPSWTNISSLSVSSASTATTATNLAGGTAGGVPYQTGAGTTGITAAGTAGNVLTSNGTSAPTWAAPAAAAAGTLTGTTLASNVTASSLTSVGTLNALAISGTSQIGVGTNGYIIDTPGDTTHTGYVAFWSPSGANRQGYIGYSSTNATTDTGTIPYVAGTHSFSGAISSNSTITGTSFTGAGTGLTGTASSLSIGGNAATVTNGAYVNANNTFTGANLFQQATNTLVTSTGGNGYGAFQATGSGTNNSYMFFADGTNGERSRITVTDARVLSISNNGGTTQHFTFDASGNFTATGNVTAYSDVRLKTDFSKIEDAVDKVKQLTGYTFTRTDTGERQTGLIAQDVQKVIPEAVMPTGEYLSVAYGNLVGLLVESIKELSAKNDELMTRIAKLEAR